jgi:hypothetical protein
VEIAIMVQVLAAPIRQMADGTVHSIREQRQNILRALDRFAVAAFNEWGIPVLPQARNVDQLSGSLRELLARGNATPPPWPECRVVEWGMWVGRAGHGWHVTITVNMWTRTDALILYRALLSPAAEQHGFSAALYGSVLMMDEANDLDLFMIPQRRDANVAAFLETLRRHMRVGDPVPGEWNRDFVIAIMADGKKLDIQFTRLSA